MGRTGKEKYGIVNLVKRGRWYHARWTDAEGRKSLALKVTMKDAAVDLAREINRQIQHGEPVVLPTRRIKAPHFSQLVDEFTNNYKEWAPATHIAHKGLLRKLVAEWGHLTIDRITTAQIEQYRARRMAEGITAATANRYMSFLRCLFDQAITWGYMGTNPAKEVKTLREAQHVPEALTEEQAEALLTAIPQRLYPLIAVALDTGLRRGELFRLQWQDIDLKRGEMIVRQTKTGRFRAVPLSRRAIAALRATRHRPGPPAGHALVFPRTDPKKALRTAGAAVGVEGLHFHMLRHTFASRLRDRGVPLDRIRELLGHQSFEMTLRYAQVRPGQLREAIDMLENGRCE